MKSRSNRIAHLAIGLLLAPLSMAWAGDVPPAGGKPLSEILRSVEDQKLGAFSEVEFDDGLWEVKVCGASACQKLYLSPGSGDETRRRSADSEEIPPPNSKPLSTIVQAIEASGAGSITEVEFDDGVWEVDLRKDGRKTKLRIDPMTGK